MKSVLTVYKKVGETPLDRIKRFKDNNPEYKNKKISYAGRLDPMAEGKLLLLIGEANKERRKYEHLDKEYLFKILFGISTDSYDILGLIKDTYNTNFPNSLEEKIDNKIKDFKGKLKQKYPPFCSKIERGKPLFYWAREGMLDQIKLPVHQIEIYALEKVSFKSIDKKELQALIIKRINKVTGDFRQEQILEKWQEFFVHTNYNKFPVAGYKIKCSSGTYIRALAHELGNKLAIPSLALKIKRTKIDVNTGN